MAGMFRFGSVAVDVPGRVVLVDGGEVHLEPQAFDLLTYLIEHRDRVVPKTELLDEVWGDQFVSESALTTRVKEVRRAVGDDGRTQGVVKNVRGRGYRFVASVEVADERQDGVDVPIDAVSTPTGRGREIEQIERALADGRVVSLVGPGGVGKTTLASAVGRRAPDAVLVDLTSISDESGVLSAWRQTAGLVGPVAEEGLSIETFASSETLWILDNCEHVVARVAELLEQFVAAGGTGRVLATSRERIGVVDEFVIPIEPLDLEAARTVFVDRAERVRPDFRLSDADSADLDVLLESIDRLPLAIEMAAGRVGMMTIGDLRTAIGNSASVLRSARRHPATRHRSIVDLVAWSEGLLTPEERSVFSGFSVFAGPVEIDDVVGVLADGAHGRADVLDALGSLVDRSLVMADLAGTVSRYRMLETTKAYVRERTDGTESVRHAQWFAAQAEAARRRLHTAEEGAASRRLADLVPELRVAHAWAREHDHALGVRITSALERWAHDRLRGEPARWAEQLLSELPEGSTAWCDVAAAIAGDAAHRADYDLAVDYGTRALSAASPRERLTALDALGNVALYRGELEQLINLTAQSAVEGSELGHEGGVVVQATVGHALALVYGGDAVAGRAVIEAHRPIPEAPSDRGWLTYGVAESLAQEDADAAIEAYRRAIVLAEESGSELLLSVSRVGLAAALARAGDPEDAVDGFRTMLDAFQRTANLTHAITALRNVTVFLARIGADRSAMELLGALSSDEIKMTFGAEKELLEESRTIVASRVGDEAVTEWMATGRTWSTRVAVQAAIDALG